MEIAYLGMVIVASPAYRRRYLFAHNAGAVNLAYTVKAQKKVYTSLEDGQQTIKLSKNENNGVKYNFQR